VAALKSRSAQTTTTGSAGPGPANFQTQLLEYAACMRKSGVPDFSDPNGSGAIKIPVAPTSPTFEAAQAKCDKLMPGGGFPIPGSATHATARALVEMLKISRCMRSHGISEFPDPSSSLPSNATGIRMVTDMHGVILAFPFTLDIWSASFAKAQVSCHFEMVLPQRG
jgi:hypothetical protein